MHMFGSLLITFTCFFDKLSTAMFVYISGCYICETNFIVQIFLLVLMKNYGLYAIFFLLLTHPHGLQGQWNLELNPTSFSFYPNWHGDTAGFMVQNEGLVSHLSEPNRTFYVSTAMPMVRFGDSQALWWELRGRLDFNPSSANYVDWYVMGDSLNLPQSMESVFVRIGNTADEVALYRKSGLSAPVKIIDGRDKVLDRSSNPFIIRVIRYPNGVWELWFSEHANEQTLFLEGLYQDTTVRPLPHMGLLVRQSTASFFGKHLFTHLYVGRPYQDSIRPVLEHHFFTRKDELVLQYNKKLRHPGVSQTRVDFSPTIKVRTYVPEDDGYQIKVILRKPVKPFTRYHIHIQKACDSLGNCSDTIIEIQPVFPRSPRPFEVLIHELMAMPEPSLGLPAHQYIELINVSSDAISLGNMRLCDRHTCAILPPFVLFPDSMVLVCPVAAAIDLVPYGPVLGVRSFPVLNKTSEDVMLLDSFHHLIHHVSYTSDWYGDALRVNGGFSLEMKDVHHPCGQSNNWGGSRSDVGGTPGKPNSISTSVPDHKPPVARDAYLRDSQILELRFDEWLHPFQEVNISVFNHGQKSDQLLSLKKVDQHRLLFEGLEPLESGVLYEVRVEGVKDCAGLITAEERLYFGIPSSPLPGQLCVNEILFHPPNGLNDYLELVHTGEHVMDLKDIRIGNLSDSGSIRETVHPFPEGLLLFPGMYVCMSASGWEICSTYPCVDSSRVFKISRLPSFPSTKGGVVVLSSDGKVLDSMMYSQHMHSPMLRDKKGVSLERISVTHTSLHPSNWASASGSSFYGTPGYRNSQSMANSVKGKDFFTLESDCFYPGHDKQGLVHYELPQSGYILRMMVFDAQGVFVDTPIRGLSLSAKGTFQWDGQCHKQWCPNGIYVLLFEAFHPNGGVAQSKVGINMIRYE